MTLLLRAVVSARGLDVDLEVPTGQTLALLGPNGAGKSTVLAVIAGLLEPDSGYVRLDGRVLTEVGGPGRDVQVRAHDRGTALLEQDALLFPHLTALDNVAFGPRSSGRRRRLARSMAREWLEQVGVGDLAERRPRQLSGGQAQRVAVARALAAEPSLLLLDEPMAALDVEVQPSLRQTLRRVLAEQTAVLVTHDPLDALLLADRVVVIESGRVVESGRSRQVLSQPRSPFAARLAGLNLVEGRWHGDHLRTASGLSVQGLLESDVRPAEGAAAVAAFRPHAVAIYREPRSGSPRNAFAVTITAVEPLGDLIRVHADELSADVTVQSVADLDLTQGQQVTFSVKAAEVSIYGFERG